MCVCRATLLTGHVNIDLQLHRGSSAVLEVDAAALLVRIVFIEVTVGAIELRTRAALFRNAICLP